MADVTIGVALDQTGERVQESVREGAVTVRVAVVSYLASVAVNTSDGRSGTADCAAQAVTVKIIIRPDSG